MVMWLVFSSSSQFRLTFPCVRVEDGFPPKLLLASACSSRRRIHSALCTLGGRHEASFLPHFAISTPIDAAASCLWDPDGSMRAAPVGRRLRKTRVWRNGASAKKGGGGSISGMPC